MFFIAVLFFLTRSDKDCTLQAHVSLDSFNSFNLDQFPHLCLFVHDIDILKNPLQFSFTMSTL